MKRSIKSLENFLKKLSQQLDNYINKIENYEDKFEDNWDIVEQLNKLREILAEAQGYVEVLLDILGAEEQ